MKTKITGLLTFLIGTFFFYSCDTDVEALEIQKLKTYDEQYFENLRAFKKSDHEISYAYYEAWSPIEGVTGYKDPASDRKSTRLNSSHVSESRMPSSA